MNAIHIPQLTHSPQRTETQEFKESLPQLETLTPVQGRVKVKHEDTYLDVSGHADTIVTLTCDRCLQQYNSRLTFEAQELIWLANPPHPDDVPEEREVLPEDLVESLPPQGYFYPDQWVYEQLCLAMPYQCLCDPECQGVEFTDVPSQATSAENPVDHRWAALAALKQNLQS